MLACEQWKHTELTIMNKEPYDKLWIGLLAGLVIPFVGYAILLMILEYLGESPGLQNARLNFDFKMRTTALLALALNILPLRYFQKRRANAGLRGVVVATMIYGLIWMYHFGQQLLGS